MSSLPERDFKTLEHKEGQKKKHSCKIKTSEVAPIVYMLTYGQADSISVWFVVVILFSVRSKALSKHT